MRNNFDLQPDVSSSPGLRDIHRLISECHVVLQSDPSCLHTRAVRGHACMKAKLWDQAVRDFSELLQHRPDDIHGRFSRGMALFKSGRVDDAHRDFSRVLELNPNHVMARYARAGCYNSEGEINQAIQEYTLALQHDEKENAGGFRSDKRRVGMHESAELLIRKTMGVSARLRNVSPSELVADVPVLESDVGHRSQSQQQNVVEPRVASLSRKKPRKVAQVRVNLSEFALAAPPLTLDMYTTTLTSSQVDTVSVVQSESANSTCSSIPSHQLQTQTSVAIRAKPKTVRRVTVAL